MCFALILQIFCWHNLKAVQWPIHDCRMKNYSFRKVRIRSIGINNSFNLSAMDHFGCASRIGKRVSIIGPISTVAIPAFSTLLPSFLNPLSPHQSNLLGNTEKLFKFSPGTHHNQKVLSVVFNSEDGGKGHIDVLKQFWLKVPGRLPNRSRRGSAASWIAQDRSFRINQRALVSLKLIENRSSVVEAWWRWWSWRVMVRGEFLSIYWKATTWSVVTKGTTSRPE